MGYYDDVEDGEIQEDKFNIAKLLIDYGADVNHKNSYDYYHGPLTYAVLGNDTKLVDLLIKNGAEVNAISLHGETPLIAAIIDGNNNNDVIRLLLERGFRKNIRDNVQYDNRTALKHPYTGVAINWYHSLNNIPDDIAREIICSLLIHQPGSVRRA